MPACVISGTIYQEVISYNSMNEIPSPVEGNGEINASSSSSSISSGWCEYFTLSVVGACAFFLWKSLLTLRSLSQTSNLESVDEILKCGHSNESY